MSPPSPVDEDAAGRSLAEVLPFVDVPAGPWDPGREAPFARAAAFLVVRGLVLHDLRLDRGGATELLGPGDLLVAWPSEDELLPFGRSLTVAEPARIAVLDGSLPEVLRRWPEVGARLVLQSAQRHQRQVAHRAASQLPRVDDRILALLWLLAERWGHVGPDGVVVPLGLTHELLGRLVGARRPTVTMAVGQLVDDGHIRRRKDRGLVLTIASRRHLVPQDGAGSKQEDLEQLVVGPARSFPEPEPEPRRPPATPLPDDLRLRRPRLEELTRDREQAHARAERTVRRSALLLERVARRRLLDAPPPR